MSHQPVVVAALQLNSVEGDVHGNLAAALPFVEQAASAGAQLIVLPEMYSGGFSFSRSLWAGAERLEDGPSRTWLCAHSLRLRTHIGM